MPTVPTVPTNLQAIPAGPNKVSCSWDPVTDLDLYAYIVGDPNGVQRLVTPSKTKAVVVDFIAASVPNIAVRSMNTNTDFSAWSTSIPVTLPSYSLSPTNISWAGTLPQESQKPIAQLSTRQVVLFNKAADDSTYIKVIDSGAVAGEARLPISSILAHSALALVSSSRLIIFCSISTVPTILEFTFTTSAATLVSQTAYGNAQSAVGDLIPLTGGAFVAVFIDAVSGHPVFLYRASGGTWASVDVNSVVGNATSSVALVQHPDGGVIWAFTNVDGAPNGSITAIKMTEAAGAITLTSVTPQFIDFSSTVGSNLEHPYLVARPNSVGNTIILAYHANPTTQPSTEYAGFFGESINGGGSELEVNAKCPIGFCSITATGTKTFFTLPDTVERLSRWGDMYVGADGSLTVFYARFDPLDMSRVEVWRNDYSGTAWSGNPHLISALLWQDRTTIAALVAQVLFGAPDGTIRLATVATAPIPPTPPTPVAIPLAPSNLVATVGRLQWQDNSSNETGFIIEAARTKGNSAWKEIVRVAANATSWGPTQSVRKYRVKSYNASGSSVPSNVVTT